MFIFAMILKRQKFTPNYGLSVFMQYIHDKTGALYITNPESDTVLLILCFPLYKY